MTLFIIINKQQKILIQQRIKKFTDNTEGILLDCFFKQAAYTVKINSQSAEYAFFQANNSTMDKAINGVWRRAASLTNAYNHIALT